MKQFRIQNYSRLPQGSPFARDVFVWGKSCSNFTTSISEKRVTDAVLHRCKKIYEKKARDQGREQGREGNRAGRCDLSCSSERVAQFTRKAHRVIPGYAL